MSTGALMPDIQKIVNLSVIRATVENREANANDFEIVIKNMSYDNSSSILVGNHKYKRACHESKNHKYFLLFY
jgi:hypothetical protein